MGESDQSAEVVVLGGGTDRPLMTAAYDVEGTARAFIEQSPA